MDKPRLRSWKIPRSALDNLAVKIYGKKNGNKYQGQVNNISDYHLHDMTCDSFDW